MVTCYLYRYEHVPVYTESACNPMITLVSLDARRALHYAGCKGGHWHYDRACYGDGLSYKSHQKHRFHSWKFWNDYSKSNISEIGHAASSIPVQLSDQAIVHFCSASLATYGRPDVTSFYRRFCSIAVPPEADTINFHAIWAWCMRRPNRDDNRRLSMVTAVDISYSANAYRSISGVGQCGWLSARSILSVVLFYGSIYRLGGQKWWLTGATYSVVCPHKQLTPEAKKANKVRVPAQRMLLALMLP